MIKKDMILLLKNIGYVLIKNRYMQLFTNSGKYNYQYC